MCSSAVRGAWLGRSKLQVRMYICMNVPYVSTVCVPGLPEILATVTCKLLRLLATTNYDGLQPQIAIL